MRRACPVTLKFATKTKRHKIRLLLQAYRGCVNRFIKALWELPSEEFGLDKKTFALVTPGRLSTRYKSSALKQAIEIVKSTRRAKQATGQKARRPRFRGCAVLDAKFVTVEEKHTCPGNPFDLVIRLSTLEKGARVTIPTCRTRPLNKWLLRPGARLVHGCALSEDSLTLWVEEPDLGFAITPPSDAVVYGADLGMTKLLTLNDGHCSVFLGRDYHSLQNRIRRCRPGSKARARLIKARDHLIGRVLNSVPWKHLDVVGIEDLTGITRGKGKLGKEFRRKRSPWAHRKVRTRLEAKAQENRVLLVAVPPKDTSRECPACRRVSALNRTGELFQCVDCRHTEDADSVGAGNIRSRTLEILAQRRARFEKSVLGLDRTHSTIRRSIASRRRQKVPR